MLRAKELENELVQARSQVQYLMGENRTLKLMEKRQEMALARYEGSHAKLPMLIKSYSEDIRTLQARLRRSKVLYRRLENRYQVQSTELMVMQKNHKHLLDLTKNKQLGEREKLSNQLEQADNTIKEQENKIQNLMKKLELQNKSHHNQITAEINKIKQLQSDLKRAKTVNDKLESKVEKFRYESYGGRRSYMWEERQIISSTSRPSAPSKVSLLNGDGHGDRLMSTNTNRKSLKLELLHDESEISDQTKDLQKNLMRQVHEDVINKPDMLANDKTIMSDSSETNSSWLNHGISELIEEKDISDTFDEYPEQPIKPIVEGNPFSLPDTFELTATKKNQLLFKSCTDDEVLTNADKNPTPKLLRKQVQQFHYDSDNDDDDDDVSSISSVSDTD